MKRTIIFIPVLLLSACLSLHGQKVTSALKGVGRKVGKCHDFSILDDSIASQGGKSSLAQSYKSYS